MKKAQGKVEVHHPENGRFFFVARTTAAKKVTPTSGRFPVLLFCNETDLSIPLNSHTPKAWAENVASAHAKISTWEFASNARRDIERHLERGQSVLRLDSALAKTLGLVQ